AVTRHYNIQASAKAIDWGNLIVALGSVYAPKVVAMGMRKSKEVRVARQQAQAGAGFVASPMSPEANPTVKSPTVNIQHPKAAGPAGGAGPVLRPKQPSDLALLDE